MAENSDGEFEKMSKEEKDQLAHVIVMRQFLFAKIISIAIGGGEENKEIKKFTMKETTKEFEKCLKKKKKNRTYYCKR